MSSRKTINWSKLILELIVVFLGVTAGFILNNLRDNQEDKRTARKYIEGLKDDVNANIMELGNAIKADSIWLSRSGYAIRQMMNGDIEADSADALVMNMVWFSEFGPRTTTYDDMINSGNLNLIKNYDLRQSIVSYHKKVMEMQVLDDYFKVYFNGIFTPYIMKELDMLNQKLADRQEYRSMEFRNLFTAYYSILQQRMKAYSDLLDESREFYNSVSAEN